MRIRMGFDLRLLVGVALFLCLPIDASALTCFKVYDARGRLVFRAPTPPVDMSGDLAKEIRARWPGGNMVSMEAPSCDPLDDLSTSAAGISSAISSSATQAPSTAFTRTEHQSPVVALPHADPASILNAQEVLPSSATNTSTNHSYSSSHTPGTDVHVRSYTRKDGTVVRSHSRAAPGRGKH